MKSWPYLTIIAALSTFFLACSEKSAKTEASSAIEPHKVGILIANHGTHSPHLQKMLIEIENATRDQIQADGLVSDVKTAFMEPTEQSVASRLKEFDKDGFTDVVIVPMSFSVNSHSVDDISAAAGQAGDQATLQALSSAQIEVYKPTATVNITPRLDFETLLQENIKRRAQAMSSDPESEGLVLVAYGDETYTKEWEGMLNRIAAYTMAPDDGPGSGGGYLPSKEPGPGAGGGYLAEDGPGSGGGYLPDKEPGPGSGGGYLAEDGPGSGGGYALAWCGEIVNYSSESTEKALEAVLSVKEKALVIPVLVAYDEALQGKVIGEAIKKFPADRVIYREDAILPDQNINQWVIAVSREYAAKAANTIEDLKPAEPTE